MINPPQWLIWAQKLQAIAQSGLFYNPPPFDRERYQQILAITADIMAAHSADAAGVAPDPAAIRALFDAQSGHATPKVDVRGAVFQDDQILLVQEKLDNYRWTLPGGWADPGESAGVAVAREVWEESGYRVSTRKLVGLYDRSLHPHPPYIFSAYKLFFLCDLTDTARRVDDANTETGEVAFFPLDALPELSIARVTPYQIARCYAHHKDRSLATEFD
jgi:8-oxo-dGTP pyrophosphatase MutT (NUDIX family)